MPQQYCRLQDSRQVYIHAILSTVTRVCRVEQNNGTFASNWVPMWAGAVEAGSPQVQLEFVGPTCLAPLVCGRG